MSNGVEKKSVVMSVLGHHKTKNGHEIRQRGADWSRSETQGWNLTLFSKATGSTLGVVYHEKDPEKKVRKSVRQIKRKTPKAACGSTARCNCRPLFLYQRG